MSKKHPIISVTGSSGAGTSTVKHTFDQIFRREGVKAVSIEGDAFHRFNRADMKAELATRMEAGDQTFSHFSYEANELAKLEEVFRTYGETGKGETRHYVHDDGEAERHGVAPGLFTDWKPFDDDSDLLFYEGLHGSVVNDDVNLAARFADHLLLLRDGVLISGGAPTDVLTPAMMCRAFGTAGHVVDDLVSGTPIFVPDEPSEEAPSDAP